ncbi:MAG TPA: cytochrome c [Steroidobacteraceae bacterium]|nr:cytochrome c [Steroidobacteraceae bacterium]
MAAVAFVFALAGSASALAADDAKMKAGDAVFQKWCAPCHAAGPNHPGTQALAALYKGSKPAALEERKDLAPEITKRFVRTGVSIMPFFRKTEISDADLDALAAYLARKH